MENSTQELKVESVSAINATQVEVKFNKAVDKATLFANGTDGAFKKVGATAADVAVIFATLDSNASGNLSGELSKDGKTLTVTAANVLSKRYDVKVSGIKSTDGTSIKAYDQMVTIAADTTAPTIVKSEKLTATTHKVTFSEPVKASSGDIDATVSYLYEDGTALPTGAAGTISSALSSDGKELTFTISGADIVNGKSISATLIGAKDKAGNLLSPNPAKVTLTKGAKDGVAPTVTSITQTGVKTFDIKFSEEVQTIATTDLSVAVAGTPNTVTKVEKSKSDATVWTVTVTNALDGLTTVATAPAVTGTPAKTITDLSGETATFSKVVPFTKDVVAPKVTSSTIVKDATDGKEYLVVTFDKNVALSTPKLASVTGSSVKDYVTTPFTASNITVAAPSATVKNAVRVDLDTLLSGADNKGAVYTLEYTFSGISSEAGVAVAGTTKGNVTFTRGETQVVPNQNKATLKTATPVVQSASDNNKVEVTFVGNELDGASATNPANYKIDGAVVKSASLAAFASGSGGSQVVTLTLEEGSNKFTGERNIEISGVKAKNGIAMDTYKNTVSLKENVAPTVEKAEITSYKKVKITFSENIVSPADSFELFIGDSTTAVAGTTTAEVVAGDKSNTVVITLASSAPGAYSTFTVADINKGITVKQASGKVVTDIALNKLKFESIKVK